MHLQLFFEITKSRLAFLFSIDKTIDIRTNPRLRAPPYIHVLGLYFYTCMVIDIIYLKSCF